MASDHCPLCNKKFGGMFGVEPLHDSAVAAFTTCDLYSPGMCHTCAVRAKDAEVQRLNAECESVKDTVRDIQPGVFAHFYVSTLDMPRDGLHTELGLVTGHSILGTGPLSSLLSSVTDLFGMESGAYQEKVCKAQNSALWQAKRDAVTLGGNAIYGVRINVTEATAGDGMIMVSVAGTAVQTPNVAQDVQELQRQSAKLKALLERLEAVRGSLA